MPDASRYAEFVFAPFQDFNTEHINHFSLASLTNFSACGFRTVASGQRLVASSPTMPYPAIYVVAKAPEHEGPWDATERDPSTDESLRSAIEVYIRSSKALLETIDGKISAALKNTGPILVWGAGQLAMKLLAETSLGRGRDRGLR